MKKVRAASSGLSGSLNELEQELHDVATAQKLLERRNALQHAMQRNNVEILKNRAATRHCVKKSPNIVNSI